MILIGSPNDPLRLDLRSRHFKSNSQNRALFLDRDGVLNYDLGYVGSKKNFRLIDPTIDLIRWAIRHRYRVILVTNQSGIGRGFFSLKQFGRLMHWVDAELQKLDCQIDACYFSSIDPEHPMRLKTQTFARKPNPEMVLAAIADFNADSSKCTLVGDKMSDVLAGLGAGIHKAVLVSGGPEPMADCPSPGSIYFAKGMDEVLTLVRKAHTCDSQCERN